MREVELKMETAIDIKKEIEIEVNPNADDVEFLYARITESNLSATGLEPAKQISAWVKNSIGEIEAGIYGWSWGGTAEVDLLWVTESRRGNGVGSALLTAFELEANERECSQIVLSTFDFVIIHEIIESGAHGDVVRALKIGQFFLSFAIIGNGIQMLFHG